MEIIFCGLKLQLLIQKALFIPSISTLVLSDIHLGKIEHFRKNGLMVPLASTENTLERLGQLLKEVKPQKVIFLGDLFHSVANNSIKDFSNFLVSYPTISFMLIKGNHDIYSNEMYKNMGLQVEHKYVVLDIYFTHEPMDGVQNVCGHIHPGIVLRGKGKQTLRLPCFHTTEERMIMPAFGYFTGMKVVDHNLNADIYVVGEEKVFCYRHEVAKR